MTVVKFEYERIVQSGYSKLVSDPNGPFGRDLQARAKRVLVSAKARAPKRTGKLAASIYSSFHSDGRGMSITIGSRCSYALLVHDGTRPHLIFPKHHRFLRFETKGKIVYARKVVHPGTRPRRFLSDALREAA